IKNIYSDPTRTTYEEFKLICTFVEFDPDNDIDPATLTVYSSVDGFTAVLGTVKLGDTFTLLDSGGQTRLEFAFDYAPGQTNNTATIGNEWILSPKNRLTTFPSAPEEVWTLIKCNPIGFAATGEPVF